MSNETVYLKIAQTTEVYKPDVYVKDIAEVHCRNRSIEAKIKTIKVTSFQTPKKGNKITYVGSIMDLLTQVEAEEKNIQIISI